MNRKAGLIALSGMLIPVLPGPVPDALAAGDAHSTISLCRIPDSGSAEKRSAPGSAVDDEFLRWAITVHRSQAIRPLLIITPDGALPVVRRTYLSC